ncbi:hypothetical protein H6F32_01150 [Anabaena sp. FACHB-1237]|uniref:hypothetical protein n=1 Tax=Anabaena sp. FACHB-1237 TaxID=2692769 RepID=UPI0016810D30|nr:hypothetical protein [Anabaena sp. FACHB-1237]MBD2136215.1 hypothetical protein [Anabaena sp. FACHB-1237]
MVTTTATTNTDDINLLEEKGKKHNQIIQKTYQNNTDSDYTEKIASLTKKFNYADNSNYYWGKPELSVFYGTPIYEYASDSQKLALNHLYWVTQYTQTAATEANTILYNQITTGVLTKVGGYQTLCQELDLETYQERFHINAFQQIGYKTKISLLGKKFLGNPLYKNHQQEINSDNKLFNLQNWLNKLGFSKTQESFSDSLLRSIVRLMNGNNVKYYSSYLEEKYSENIPITRGGLVAYAASQSFIKFLTLNWGTSPFLASQYYALRMIGNMSLKAYEYSYYKLFKHLEKNNEFIPDPTAVSYYHLLDESFHTTMSQTISQDLYKDLPKPTEYEKLIANIVIYLAQKNIVGGFSAALPHVFRNDVSAMSTFYRFLTSPVFNMSKEDALNWMERSLCNENEGIHLNFKHHQDMIPAMCRFVEPMDFLWPVNREMKIMSKNSSIEKVLHSNTAAFQNFSQSLI